MRRILALWAALGLSACAVTPQDATAPAPESAYRERVADVSGWKRWGFTARLSVDDGDEGGSGRLDWRSEESGQALDFRGALGQGAWQLRVSPNASRLTLSDGRVVEGASVHEVIQRETGWRIPIDRLAWWVRGVDGPDGDPPPEAELSADGLLTAWQRDDWVVTIDRTTERNGLLLPSRMQASQGDVRIRLAISRWWFERPDGD